ncbi:hypothetical protein TorRG33x02_173090 [Trema orientale]|uniref:Uncharacterized protein n=1 Tax=Trema orientale TaxID=63057 RepID=A0A2P5EN83_TREOI|nr:hypothetical protein TorRG33x02_173090 [Trema orientale]
MMVDGAVSWSLDHHMELRWNIVGMKLPSSSLGYGGASVRGVCRSRSWSCVAMELGGGGDGHGDGDGDGRESREM